MLVCVARVTGDKHPYPIHFGIARIIPMVQWQERICCRRTPVSSRGQHSNGLEERKPKKRVDATPAPRRGLGLATIVPLDASQQTNRTPTGVPVACGLLLA